MDIIIDLDLSLAQITSEGRERGSVCVFNQETELEARVGVVLEREDLPN